MNPEILKENLNRDKNFVFIQDNLQITRVVYFQRMKQYVKMKFVDINNYRKYFIEVIDQKVCAIGF